MKIKLLDILIDIVFFICEFKGGNDPFYYVNGNSIDVKFFYWLCRNSSKLKRCKR